MRDPWYYYNFWSDDMHNITPALTALGAQGHADSTAMSAYHIGGGMHKAATDNDGNFYPLCVIMESLSHDTPRVMTNRLDLIDCQKCLELLHA